MSDHLPECPMEVHKGEDLWDDPLFGFPCWCYAIRAREQRVLAEQLAGHEMAYDAGVQAARDAVKNAPWLTMCIGTEANPGVEEPWVRATDALNAIDALRED